MNTIKSVILRVLDDFENDAVHASVRTILQQKSTLSTIFRSFKFRSVVSPYMARTAEGLACAQTTLKVFFDLIRQSIKGDVHEHDVTTLILEVSPFATIDLEFFARGFEWLSQYRDLQRRKKRLKSGVFSEDVFLSWLALFDSTGVTWNLFQRHVLSAVNGRVMNQEHLIRLDRAIKQVDGLREQVHAIYCSSFNGKAFSTVRIKASHCTKLLHGNMSIFSTHHDHYHSHHQQLSEYLRFIQEKMLNPLNTDPSSDYPKQVGSSHALMGCNCQSCHQLKETLAHATTNEERWIELIKWWLNSILYELDSLRLIHSGITMLSRQHHQLLSRLVPDEVWWFVPNISTLRERQEAADTVSAFLKRWNGLAIHRELEEDMARRLIFVLATNRQPSIDAVNAMLNELITLTSLHHRSISEILSIDWHWVTSCITRSKSLLKGLHFADKRSFSPDYLLSPADVIILRALYDQLEGRVGVRALTDVLKGANTTIVRQYSLDQLSCHGELSGLTKNEIKLRIHQLEDLGLIIPVQHQGYYYTYSLLKISEDAKFLLNANVLLPSGEKFVKFIFQAGVNLNDGRAVVRMVRRALLADAVALEMVVQLEQWDSLKVLLQNEKNQVILKWFKSVLENSWDHDNGRTRLKDNSVVEIACKCFSFVLKLRRKSLSKQIIPLFIKHVEKTTKSQLSRNLRRFYREVIFCLHSTVLDLLSVNHHCHHLMSKDDFMASFDALACKIHSEGLDHFMEMILKMLLLPILTHYLDRASSLVNDNLQELQECINDHAKIMKQSKLWYCLSFMDMMRPFVGLRDELIHHHELLRTVQSRLQATNDGAMVTLQRIKEYLDKDGLPWIKTKRRKKIVLNLDEDLVESLSRLLELPSELYQVMTVQVTPIIRRVRKLKNSVAEFEFDDQALFSFINPVIPNILELIAEFSDQMSIQELTNWLRGTSYPEWMDSRDVDAENHHLYGILSHFSEEQVLMLVNTTYVSQERWRESVNPSIKLWLNDKGKARLTVLKSVKPLTWKEYGEIVAQVTSTDDELEFLLASVPESEMLTILWVLRENDRHDLILKLLPMLSSVIRGQWFLELRVTDACFLKHWDDIFRLILEDILLLEDTTQRRLLVEKLAVFTPDKPELDPIVAVFREILS